MKTWSYFVNPFLVVGSKSFKKAVKISIWHDSALEAAQGDPFFGPMYTAYHNIHLDLLKAYNKWKTSGGTHKGATLTVEQLLVLLSPGKINAWDSQVQIQFAKGSPNYISIFPQGHKPFQHGERDERINAVEQLVLALDPFAPLSATKADVDAFYTQINTARTAQLGKESDTGHFSDDVRLNILGAMRAMYGNLGLIMDHFKTHPVQGEPYFDLETVRNHQQVIFTGTLEANEHEVVFEHLLAEDDEILLESKGNTNIRFYMTEFATDGPGTNPVIDMAAQHKEKVLRSVFGNPANRFLHVVNLEAAEGKYKVQLM